MSKQLPMPTRGPVRIVEARGSRGELCYHNLVDSCARSILMVPAWEGDGKVNADLIAAAFNAATAAQDMGFDPIGAVEALPTLLETVREYKNCRSINPDDPCFECDQATDEALSAARTRGGAK